MLHFPMCMWWRETKNVGDRFCGVSLHVGLNAEPVHFDQPAEDTRGRMVIVGGGGMLYPPMQHLFKRLFDSKPACVVVWGIGTNTHDVAAAPYPDWLKRCDLVGLRDADSPYDWAPCASCMSPLFDNPPPPTRPVVVYRHYERKAFPAVPDAPVMLNNVTTMDEAVAFLASGETIVTDSYHGAYWGALLGRRVALTAKWSTKFHRMPYPPGRSLGDATAYPDALRESREATARFADKVRALLRSRAHANR
jgi:hypothetical protein